METFESFTKLSEATTNRGQRTSFKGGELSFQIVINLQMLCKGICLDSQCAMCVHVNYVCGLLINKLVNFFHLVSLNFMPLCDEEWKEEIQQLDVCVFA